MDYIKGFTFGFVAPKGSFRKKSARESLKLLSEKTSITHVIFAIAALQDTAQSIEIDYKGEHIVGDEELIEMIKYAKSLGLKTILKPLVNVRNGTWRAHISFFDQDVPCEPSWHDWFKSYEAYQCHYAKIAQKTGCEMLIVGCEMVQANKRDNQWRSLINNIRKHFNGLISYNADKYQEDRISWWDAVDVISSSGYYPKGSWSRELERIERVINKYNKPFFFAEAGCMSKDGSSLIPNNWSLTGTVNLNEQADYYDDMFKEVSKKSFVKGFGLWDWRHQLYEPEHAQYNDDYAVFNKPAEKVIKSFYENK